MSTTEAAPKLSMDDFKKLSRDDMIAHLIDLDTRANELKIRKENLDVELERLQANDDTNGPTLRRLERNLKIHSLVDAFRTRERVKQAKARMNATVETSIRTAIAALEDAFQASKMLEAQAEAKDVSGEAPRRLREDLRNVDLSQSESVGEAGGDGQSPWDLQPSAQSGDEKTT
ncbi:hypothetical protein SLS60_002648 [Paraconiothyrium brasiliense]|uniref:Uncharacterized protein n=1 Tax=Paraconiothyrium brasiliense TaxID=300254 RepID=A0ABR3RTE5_9PLEO